jgi:hypothetical protein
MFVTIGVASLTVNEAFKSKTPCFAKGSKLPDGKKIVPKSSLISLKILRNDGGIRIPSFTEKPVR